MKQILYVLTILTVALLSIAHGQSPKLVGEIDYYSALRSINHLNALGDTLVVSTNQGVTFIVDDQQVLFGKKEGITQSNTLQTLTTSKGLLALSDKGTLSSFLPTQQSFNTLHTSYTSAGYTPLRPHAISYGRYLILPFQEGLSFFDLNENRSYLTVTKIGNLLIENSQFKDIYLYNDTLAVLIDQQIWTIPVDSTHLDSAQHSNGKKVNVVDPKQWFLLRDSLAANLQTLSYRDSLQARPGMGKWEFSENESRALSNVMDTLIIDGKKITDSLFYQTTGDSNTLNNSVIDFIKIGKTEYLTNGKTLFKNTLNAEEVSLKHSLANENYTNLLISGSVFAWAVQSLWVLNNEQWDSAGSFPSYNPEAGQLFAKRSQPIARSKTGDLYIGSWGGGIHRTGSNENRQYLPSSGDCLKGVFTAAPNYAIVTGLTTDAKGNVWFANYSEDATDKYTIGYIDKTQEMTCFASIGTGKQTGELQFNPFDSTELVVVYYTGIDIYDVQADIPELKSTKDASHVNDIFQVEWDGQKRMWALGGDRLILRCPEKLIDGICFNQDFKDSLLDVSLIFGVQGGGFSNLERDPLGNLWLSTRSAGAYYIEASKDSLRGSDVTHFDRTSGLFSDEVYDIKVNQNSGEVWFLHPDGITVYQSQARDASLYSPEQVRVFPNPYRADRHQAITFDQLPQNSEILIYNESRQLVTRIQKDDIVGGYYKWIPTTHYGKAIKGGVYTWVVKSPHANRMGHLIVVK